jgi:tetratricopeptide (TPR) repeat protein
MARADLKASFEAAIRHLFRHFNDAKELRRNPITSYLFKSGGSRGDQRDAIAIEQLRLLIADAAARFAREGSDGTAVTSARRVRQAKMVTRCCFEGASPKKVAAELGLSKSRFYREYREVCEAIARALHANGQAAAAVRLGRDRASFQLEHASAQAEAGDYDEAIRTYDELLRTGLPPEVRVDTLCRRVEVELERGRVGAARPALATAVGALAAANGELAGMELAALKARLELLCSKLAWANADFSTAAAALDTAQQHLAPFRSLARNTITPVQIDVLLERGNRERLHGNFLAAMTSVEQVRQLARSALGFSPQQQIDTTLLEARVTFLAAGSSSAYTPARYVALLKSALDAAKAYRSLRRTIEVEVELTDPFFDANSAMIALDAARLLMSKARQLRNPHLVAYVAIYMADRLYATRFWPAIPAILREALQVETEGSREWAHMALVLSSYHRKIDELTRARKWADAAWRAAERSGSPRVAAAALRCLANAALGQGRRGEADEYIRAALPVAERCASAEARVLTYCVAHKVTRDGRYRRAALELESAVAGA